MVGARQPTPRPKGDVNPQPQHTVAGARPHKGTHTHTHAHTHTHTHTHTHIARPRHMPWSQELVRSQQRGQGRAWDIWTSRWAVKQSATWDLCNKKTDVTADRRSMWNWVMMAQGAPVCQSQHHLVRPASNQQNQNKARFMMSYGGAPWGKHGHSQRHTHKNTHTQQEGERERERDNKNEESE